MSDLLTIDEVARVLNVSPETVTRRFAGVKGVVDMGTKESPRKRRYRLLRIPRTVVEKWILERGGRITVPPANLVNPVNSKAKSRDLASVNENDLTRDLAALASQSGDAARKTLERIASRAKAMTYVPTEEWEDMVFFPDEG